MTIRKFYIRYKESLPEGVNLFAAQEGLDALGIKTAPFYGFGDIDTLDDLGPETGIAGFLGDVATALKKIGKPVPDTLDYPPELTEFLRREIRLSTLGEVKASTQHVFLKPVEHKLFTGLVWRASRGERLALAIYSDDTPVWVSDLVDFRAEYRCFVLDGEVLGVRLYKGDWAKAPSRDFVYAAIKAFETAPRSYSLDVGVTEDGQTAMVEVNDSYALGNYGLNSTLYARMIEARWEEMTA